MAKPMHGNETAGISEPAGTRESAVRVVPNQKIVEPVEARAERRSTRRTYLSRDGWIGLILLLTAVVASISMSVIHRSHIQQQESTPPVIGERSSPPARTYLPLPTAGPDPQAPSTASPNPRSPLTFIWHPPPDQSPPPDRPPMPEIRLPWFGAPAVPMPTVPAPAPSASHG